MKSDVVMRVLSSYLVILLIVVLGFSKEEVAFAIIIFAILDFYHLKKELL